MKFVNLEKALEYLKIQESFTEYYLCIKEYFDMLFFTRHCIKSVRIRSYSGPYFTAFGLNTERYEESLRIQSECGKIRARITPNKDTFHAVRNIFCKHKIK